MSKKSDLSYIHEQLRGHAVEIGSIRPDPRNAREHDKRNKAAVRHMLTEYGQLLPIVVNSETRVIEKGNCTWGEAKALGWTHIAVVFVEHDELQAMRFGVEDNRLGELGNWEYQTLGEILRDLSEFEDSPEIAGFSDAEIESLLQADWQPPAPKEDFAVGVLTSAQPAEDDAAEPTHAGSVAPPSEHDAGRAKAIATTPAQRETIDRAIEHVRLINDDEAITEGRCIELVCGDYLAGV